MSVYTRPPQAVVDGIPVFTDTDEYVANYEAISAEHLAHADANNGANPWMPADHWAALEQTTSKVLVDRVPAGATVLDIGVGLGRFAALHGAYTWHGIDISHGYLQRAKAAGVDVAFASAEDIPYPDEFFDCVCATDVLEHVLDLNRALAEAVRVLKPGGWLVVRTPDGENLGQYVGYKYRFVHLRIFTGDMFRLILDRLHNLVVTDVVSDRGEVTVSAQKP
jgi:ubiquinone/menaquinone biosynthesis C-methylase UbiE